MPAPYSREELIKLAGSLAAQHAPVAAGPIQLVTLVLNAVLDMIQYEKVVVDVAPTAVATGTLGD